MEIARLWATDSRRDPPSGKAAVDSVEDAQLVSDVLGGDPTAFRRLVERHSARVHSIAYQLVGNGEDARDLAQDIFLRVHQTLHRYDSRRPFGAWLYRLAVNLGIDYRRKNRRHRRPAGELVGKPVASGELGPDARLESDQLQGAISQLLEGLSAKQRKVFVLRDLQGFSSEEVAVILGCRPATVRVHLARARQRLGKGLRRYFPELVEGRDRERGSDAV